MSATNALPGPAFKKNLTCQATMPSFTAVKSTRSATSEPNRTYFTLLEHQAQKVANSQRCTAYEDAWALCNYIDAVDSGAYSEFHKSLYHACCYLLRVFLLRCPQKVAERLCGSSWAAQTLWHLDMDDEGHQDFVESTFSVTVSDARATA